MAAPWPPSARYCMAFGKRGPARQRFAQRADTALVAGGGAVAEIVLSLRRECAHRVERKPIMLIDVRTHALIEQRFHFHLLFAVVLDGGRIEAGLVAAALAHLACRFDIVERAAEQFSGDPHYFFELLLVSGVDRPFQRVEPRLHAFVHRFGKGHRCVGGQKNIGHCELALQVTDGVHQQARVHERFAEIKHADFLDAGFAHLACHALEETKVHVPLRLHFA